jgi:hypothetical protein
MSMAVVESYNFATVENPLSDGGNFTIVADADFTGSLKAIAGNLCEPTTLSAPGAAFWSGAVPAPSNAWPNDHASRIVIASGSAVDTFYLLVRQGAAGSGTQYLVNFKVGAGTAAGTLFAIVAGTAHTLTTFTGATIANGDQMTFTVTGNVLTLTDDTQSTTIVNFTDTNNFIASGSPGFGLNNTTAITDTQVNLWAGLANQAATPTFSPNGGSFGPAQTVTITSTTPGGTIFYTTDGTTPTHSSSSISNGGTISVSASATVKAIASVTDFVDSAVGSATFTINGAVATPTFEPVAGSYTGIQNVTVLDANSALPGFAMFYTLDGSTPTTGSTPYTGAITIATTTTIKVLATATGFSNSNVASATYTITISSSKRGTRSK